MKPLRTRFFYRTPPKDCFWKEALGRGQDTVLIAVPNDICKAYYQKGSVVCFLKSIYSRFVEFLIELMAKVLLVLVFSQSLELYRILSLAFHLAN